MLAALPPIWLSFLAPCSTAYTSYRSGRVSTPLQNSKALLTNVTGRSATLVGTTGTAFTLAFQSCIGQVGGVVGPQLFQSKYAYNGYKTSFGICAAAIGVSWIFNGWTWYLTAKNENDIRRVKRLRIKAHNEGRVWAGEDVKL